VNEFAIVVVENPSVLQFDGPIWYHAAVTFNGTNWQLYLNGELETDLGVGASTNANGTLPRYDSIQHAGLGTALNSSGTAAGFFNGVMDEARIWNYARTRQQIRDNMNRTIANECGLVARWALDEGSGTNVYNSAGATITGTNYGSGFTWTNSAPFNAGGAALLVVGNTNSADTNLQVRLQSLVIGRSKPAREGQMKTGHFESGIAHGAAMAAQVRDEPTQREPATFHCHAGSQRLVGPKDCPRTGRPSGDGGPVSAPAAAGFKTGHSAPRLAGRLGLKTGHCARRVQGGPNQPMRPGAGGD